MSISQSLRQTQSVSLPPQDWSMVNAYEEDAKHDFTFPLTHRRRRLDNFDRYTHEQRLQLIDFENRLFQFAYNEGEDEDGEPAFFKIPLMRDSNVEIEDIAVELNEDEYCRAKYIVDGVGEMERIARAVRYHELFTNVRDHLKTFECAIQDAVLVSVDRGGRLPTEILCRALDVKAYQSLKVDQAGGDNGALDTAKMDEFVSSGVLRGKHVLFVDSTVDSGRQIQVLKKYFESDEWKVKLGFKSWSVVGSNEDGETLKHHLNVNWGVDPDTTFEDRPELMGIDYAPGSRTSVVDVPSVASQRIRDVFFSVPDGYTFDVNDLDMETIESERRSAETKNTDVPLELRDRIRALCNIVTASEQWEKWKEERENDWYSTSMRYLPLDAPQRVSGKKFLLIGDGNRSMNDEDIQRIARSFDPQTCHIITGTEHGTPGNVARSIGAPWDRHSLQGLEKQSKYESRAKMIDESDEVIVLGGAEGTLYEALLAIAKGKDVRVVNGWGPAGTYLSKNVILQRQKCLKVFGSLADSLMGVNPRSIPKAVPVENDE